MQCTIYSSPSPLTSALSSASESFEYPKSSCRKESILIRDVFLVTGAALPGAHLQIWTEPLDHPHYLPAVSCTDPAGSSIAWREGGRGWRKYGEREGEMEAGKEVVEQV